MEHPKCLRGPKLHKKSKKKIFSISVSLKSVTGTIRSEPCTQLRKFLSYICREKVPLPPPYVHTLPEAGAKRKLVAYKFTQPSIYSSFLTKCRKTCEGKTDRPNSTYGVLSLLLNKPKREPLGSVLIRRVAADMKEMANWIFEGFMRIF